MHKCMNLNGVGLTYLEQGQGLPVVFVHGAVGDHRTWGLERQEVTEPYRYIALDQRYFGTAPWADSGAEFSATTHVNDLAAFIRVLEAGPVNLVGWSYGGAIALTLAVQHPELIRSVFLFEPTIGSVVSDQADAEIMAQDRKDMFALCAASVRAGDNAAAVRLLVDGVTAVSGTFDAFASEVRTVLIENGRILPLLLAAPPPPVVTCAQLAQIGVPVAVARGELTRPFYRIIADAVNRCIPASLLITIPKARHLWPGQDPSGFNEALLGFLKNC
jgi:pimeloyl-ACP methyl ester carboxylesterase